MGTVRVVPEGRSDGVALSGSPPVRLDKSLRGVDANARLTGTVAAVLLVLLAAEGSRWSHRHRR
jgi:hypothetical protein